MRSVTRQRPDAGELLGAVATALTACEAAGIKVKLKHGAVITRFGFVFPVGDAQWGARTLAYSPFGAPHGDDHDD